MAYSKPSVPSGGGSAADPKAFVMPRPPAIVVWRPAPGGDAQFAIVTKYGKSAISLAVIAPESRVLAPKDAVRYVDDPWNKTHPIDPDSGVWELTEESKLLLAISGKTNV